MKKLLLTLALAVPVAAGATTPLWLRDVKISPDGSAIAFCYKGDIYTVPTAGGQATRLTATDDYEANPIWSPDSRSIAYATDRNGNFDIYVIDAKGGTPRRLTYNSAREVPEAFTPDGKNVLFSAVIQDPVTSAAFPSGRLTELYSVPVAGGPTTQVLGTPARYVNWMSDGKSFLYQDVKGFEDEWRKHHTSSVTRDIWLYNASTGRHTNLTNRGGEDTDPVVASNSEFYFLSERNGSTVNVYKASINNAADAQAVTSFKTHPVRFLSRAADGTLAFTYDGEIYTMAQGGKPVKVAIDVVEDSTPDIEKLSVRGGASEAEPAPDGKTVAFIYRGDVFVTSVEYSTTKQITRTPEAESDITWAPDGKTLYYTTERDGRYNIYKAFMTRADEEFDWAHATIVKEEPVFKKDEHERTLPKVSPDGKKLAFILDRHVLAVLDLKSGKVKKLTDGSTYLQNDGRFNYSWSPDSKWLTLEIIDRKRDPYTDIALLNAETGQLTNLTNSGYFDSEPKFVLDGNAIMFASERYGMRNHASWGSMYDVMLIFLNQDAYDQYVLDEEDYEIYKEVQKNKDKNSEGDNDKDKDKSKDKDGDEADKDITVELGGITDRIVRVTPQSSNLVSAALTSDGESLLYIIEGPDGYQLWKLSPREDEHKMLTSLSSAGSLVLTPDGKNMFLLGRSLRKVDPKSGKLTNISFSSTMTLNHDAEREFMFDNMVREEGARFYTPTMHGIDWPAMTDHYRRFLPHINNNYDFAELLSELLGELNVSHTGGRYGGKSAADGDRTASLGLLYDLTYTGKGMRVAEVLDKGPFAKAASKVAPGTVVEYINGQEITPTADLSTLLTDLAGDITLVGLYNPATGERWEETIRPISAGKQSALLYDRWVKSRAAAVDSLSNGRLGYVHIESMDDESFRRVYSDLLGKYNDREGVVIDIRWNGGGRLHEDVEVLFSGQKYFTQEIRGVESCDMPSRRWNKPSIMVMCEACYSNAHGTPWVYKHQGIGKLVGMPVPGTMTSVNWVRMQDSSLIYGIPVIGYRLPDGSFLENQQLEPDIKVNNDPNDIVRGVDAQLEAAVRELLREIDGK